MKKLLLILGVFIVLLLVSGPVVSPLRDFLAVHTDGNDPLIANWDAGSYQIRAETFRSDVTTGTAPFTVGSKTKVDNLNADYIDGNDLSLIMTKAIYDTDTDNDIDQAAGGTNIDTSGVTNGQLLIGNSTGNVWALATITGTASEITVANAGSSITLSLPNHAGTDITADLEEEVTEGSLADSVIISADIKDDTIAEADLDMTDTPTDEDILTYESGAGGSFEWHSAAEMGIGVATSITDNSIVLADFAHSQDYGDFSIDAGGTFYLDTNSVAANELLSGDYGDISIDGAGAITVESGTATTATALAANGANAEAGHAILGVDASGAAEGAFDVWTEAENTAAAYISATLTQEQVDDYVYALISDADSVHTLITITYDDTDNAYDFVVDNDLHNYSWTNVVDADITDTLTSSTCTGNAATATALETARTIAGVSFNGTANITIASTDLSDTTDLKRKADTRTVFCFNIHDIDDGMDDIKMPFPMAITITKVTAFVTGGTSVVGRLYEVDGDGDDGDAVGVEVADWTFTVGETEDSSFNNATFDAGDYIQWDTTTVNGSVTGFMICVDGYET